MELTNSIESYFGSKFFYSISEASSLLDISESHLLQLVAEEKIEGLVLIDFTNLSGRYVKCSHDERQEVYLSFSEIRDQTTVKFEKNSVVPTRVSYKSLVHLSVDDAKYILVRGKTTQRKFIEIFEYNTERRDILGRNRKNFSKKLLQAMTRFSTERLVLRDQPISGNQLLQRQIIFEKPIVISRSNIQFALPELMNLVRYHYLMSSTTNIASSQYNHLLRQISRESNDKSRIKLQEFQRKAYHSQKLLDLIQVANYFWCTIYLEDESFPLINDYTNDISDYLEQNYEFDSDLSKIAARFITPAYAQKKPDIKHQLMNFGIATERLQILIEASEYFYSKLDLNSRKEFPEYRRIEAWFMSVHCFPVHLAAAAAKIIEPLIDDVEDFIASGT